MKAKADPPITKKATPRKPSKKRVSKPNFSDSFEEIVARLIALMKKPGSGVKEQDLDVFIKKIHEMWNYTPTICLFGQIGAGKSSLCNALFGEEKFEISAIEACTQGPQHGEVVAGKNKIKIIDMPGVGESHSADEKYQLLYLEVMKDADLVIWALKADSRAYASDQKAWELIREKAEKMGLPAFFILTQSDKIDPIKEWDHRKAVPGPEQMGNLLLKKKSIGRNFNVPTERIREVLRQMGRSEVAD
ncbi:MAG: GTPase, partial [Terrimicrobiaceae bacterium]